VAQAGGFAVELPSLSVDESFTKPTSMLYRNMLAMEAEEMIRSHPFDGVVLMGGCDKTTPALVMGAISANVPFIYLPAGPMLRGAGRHRPLGRHLHDDGHRLDDDGDHRCDGADAARRLLDPRRRLRPPAHVRRLRPAHRRDGLGGAQP
jgi:hypothetical protein